MLRNPVRAALAALAAAGAAHAQTVQAPTQASKPAITLSVPAASSYAQAQAAQSTSFPRTALDLHFTPKDLTGQVGYLCGLEPGPYRNSSPASSADPEGTFLGGKLSLAFK